MARLLIWLIKSKRKWSNNPVWASLNHDYFLWLKQCFNISTFEAERNIIKPRTTTMYGNSARLNKFWKFAFIDGKEVAFELDFFLNSWGALFRPSKIAKPAVFQAVLRGIGKSFQSAITAPRINLPGYGNATAQSWLSNTGKHFCSKTSFSSMWDVINISQAH